MTAACKLMHLVEAFSTPWFLLANKTNHKLVFFLLEMLNNLVQYQFDGNSNLAYTMIRKRHVFHQLANLPTDGSSIEKTVSKESRRQLIRTNSGGEDKTMEGSLPALPAQPGTLKTSLLALPRIESLTEGVSAHPTQRQLDKLTQSRRSGGQEVSPAQPGVEQVSSELEEVGLEGGRSGENWAATSDWVKEWKDKLPLQTIMRMLQVRSLYTVHRTHRTGHRIVTGLGSSSGEDVYRQGADGRDRDHQVPPERDSGGTPACATSNPDQEISSKQGHGTLVQDLHVGSPLPQEQQSSLSPSLGGHQGQDVQCPEDVKRRNTVEILYVTQVSNLTCCWLLCF